MFTTIACKTRKDLRAVKSHPVASNLTARQRIAFSVLHPQVQIVKRSPVVQIVAGSLITAAVVSGNWGTAAAITGCWLGAKPLTYAVAGGVACVGAVDAGLLAALERLQGTQVEPAEASTAS
jgi:hypothetical protein